MAITILIVCKDGHIVYKLNANNKLINHIYEVLTRF